MPDVHPTSGVLAYDESIHIGQRGYDRAGVAPAFPFGHGIGYITWSYIEVEEPEAGADTVTLRVRLRNTGIRRGREVVQVYASRPDSTVDRPDRWLAGFATVEAEPAEETIATVTIPLRVLQHWDTADRSWTTEAGAFRFDIGSSAQSGQLSAALVVNTGTV